ncbi:acyl-CoA dehydrogenase [uncultured Celeribacter sp.]|uniref:acyl-CoA dehydrogenase n=1 Tax=uncultured Celeribacter sp. TaxID=1303376 RepID=UPI002AA5E981|nr:acyl-CoA dehydrogenase [uncultured Celeribacter sp.]
MTYVAPTEDMMFVLEELCRLDEIAHLPGLEDATPDMVAAILEEAGKFAGDVLGPLNAVGDQAGLGFAEGEVTTPEGWRAAYETLVEMGWNAPTASPDHGGMGLPEVVNAAILEMLNGANTAFQLCPLLTQGAIEAINGYASDDLKALYLPKLVTGEWTGTMNLTEPQAGSDLAAIRSKAVPEGDHYRISGQKIFITYGEHDMAENIVHLVLARLPDAPAGVKGISLFIVPKFIPDAEGAPGARNDLRCVSIEHKLGIHASPTCTMSYGDEGGAIGYLVGEPHKGLPYMFTMMNNARLGVGLQGVGISEAATQHAVRYAMDRVQGGTPEGTEATIMGHPDIRRMLGLMKARTEAARALAFLAARSLDFAHRAEDDETRALHQRRVDLLIPVAKAWSTELSVHAASLGVQIHGGMGYIEETGAAQHLRDARITTIYEGTTGIQALDLVGRKIKRDNGTAARELVAEMKATAEALKACQGGEADWAALATMVEEAAGIVGDLTDWLVAQNGSEPLSAAVNILETFGVCLGAWVMGDAAMAAAKRISEDRAVPHAKAKLNMVRFYATNVFPTAAALHAIAKSGNRATLALEASDFALAV